jgi:hypothetical protein
MFLYEAFTADIELVRQLKVDIHEQTAMLNKASV